MKAKLKVNQISITCFFKPEQLSDFMKNKPLFLGFVESCGLTLFNRLFANGVPTYEIPNQKRSIIDFGLTNAVGTVSNFKVLPTILGVSPQTCHKVIELSINTVLSQ